MLASQSHYICRYSVISFVQWTVMDQWRLYILSEGELVSNCENIIIPPPDFSTTYTEDGICYTFNADGVRAIVNGTGRSHALRLVLNAEKYEYTRAAGAGPRGQFATGVRVIVHQAEETNFQGKGFLVAPGTHTEVIKSSLVCVHCNRNFSDRIPGRPRNSHAGNNAKLGLT